MAISTNSYSEHLRRLKFVLQRLEWVNLQLSPSKTRLMAKSITFLGKTLSSKGIEIDESKIKAILELPSPKNVKHLKNNLGNVELPSFIYSQICRKSSYDVQTTTKRSKISLGYGLRVRIC